MHSVRETYDLPKRPPLPFRPIAVMLTIPVAALLLWLAPPDSPITGALLVIALLIAVSWAWAWFSARTSSTRCPLASR